MPRRKKDSKQIELPLNGGAGETEKSLKSPASASRDPASVRRGRKAGDRGPTPGPAEAPAGAPAAKDVPAAQASSPAPASGGGKSKAGNSVEAPLAQSYRNWFLEYASYVILDRAVPHIDDGLKPVQRRILHTLWEMDDGRFHKVANVVGATMRFHPHGDASIEAALVGMAQRGLLVEPQGNFGNVLTGDGAAAARYIEARLTPFAREVVFNPKTTIWQLSYDGRAKEPE
jgi:topoisomerase-4 subunit A